MVALFLTFLSLLLTVVVGAVFLLGVHRLVLLVVGFVESRSAETPAEDSPSDERPVHRFSLRDLVRH